MSTLQEYLATATPKAATDLITALERIPADKRNWSPGGTARTALDQIAECAILNGSTADLLKAKAWTMGSDFSDYMRQKAELGTDEADAVALLKENTARAVEAIKAVADADLEIVIEMPWQPITLAQSMAYPFWNMCYHEGQINYIASILGCLE